MLTLKRNQYVFNSKIIGTSFFTPSISPPCHNLKKIGNKIKTLATTIITVIILIKTTTTTTIIIIIIIIRIIITAAPEGIVVQGYNLPD